MNSTVWRKRTLC